MNFSIKKVTHYIYGLLAAMVMFTGLNSGCSLLPYGDNLTEEERLQAAQQKMEEYRSANEFLTTTIQNIQNVLKETKTERDELILAMETMGQDHPQWQEWSEKAKGINEEIGQLEGTLSTLETTLESNRDNIDKIKTKVDNGDLSGLSVDGAVIGGTAQTVAPLLPFPWNILVSTVGGVVVSISEKRRMNKSTQFEQVVLGVNDVINESKNSDSGIPGVTPEQIKQILEKYQDPKTEVAVKKVKAENKSQ